MTLIVVTHELQSAFLIADRMCMLDQARILAVGTVKQILDNPHPRIQQFVQRIADDAAPGSQSYVTGFE